MPRPIRVVLAIALLAGCHKKPSEGLAGGVPGSGPAPEVEQRPDVVGPLHWWDKTGLCLEVPEGWSGSGRGSDGTLLTLQSAASGVRFGIFEASRRPDRADLSRVFADSGTYRDIPALGGAGVESWVSDVPGGPSLQVWEASVRDAPIRIEARYPFGSTFAGMHEIDTLLRALCVE